MEIDFAKTGLKYFTHEEDDGAIKGIIEAVLPLLKGKSLNQIEKALDSINGLVKSNLLVSN